MNTPVDQCTAAIRAAEKAGARYVEVRHTKRLMERLVFSDGRVELATHLDDTGMGIRALVGDSWGYAGTNLTTRAALTRAAQRAVQAAKGVSTSGVIPEIPEPVTGHYETSLTQDPFNVALERKRDMFAAAHDTILSIPGTSAARGDFTATRINTRLCASNGSDIHQVITLCGGGIAALVETDSGYQRRSTPKSHEGNVVQSGFEALAPSLATPEAERVAREAVMLARAEPLPNRMGTIVLDGAQLSLQIHESIGHPTELDRVQGEEISLAGASFLLPEHLDAIEIGSSLVNLTADSTSPLGPGTFAFDDEGTPACRVPLVKEGRLVGFLSGRDSAARIKRPSAACLRAESWSSLPIVRMVNVNLEPGEGSLDDLIAGVDDGVLMSVNKSWSIDELRLNFQFGCEAAYEIKGGSLTGRLFANPVYQGVTPDFWKACSGIAGPEAWKMWGWSYCGKGDPIQVMHVGHGCAPARFEGIQMRAS